MPRLRSFIGLFLLAAVCAQCAVGSVFAQQTAPSALPGIGPLGPNDTVVRANTRYGPLSIVTRHPTADAPSVIILYGPQKVVIDGAYGGSLDGQYQLGIEDVLIVSSTFGARGVPPSYMLLAVDGSGLHQRNHPDFTTADDTFKVQQSDAALLFDLGYEMGKLKKAEYRDGRLTVSVAAPVGRPQLSRDDCAWVLEQAVQCRSIPNCRFADLTDVFSMGVFRGLNTLSQQPAFNMDTFAKTCANICRTRTYSVAPVRKQLCGY